MLLPENIHPENSIYYNGALVLDLIHKNNTIDFTDLYIKVKETYDIRFSIFVLCLDWLYLIDAAIINNNGEVSLCS